LKDKGLKKRVRGDGEESDKKGAGGGTVRLLN